MEQLPVINPDGYNSNRTYRYTRAFILKVVKEVEEGLSQKEACDLYGMAKMTIRQWLQQYSDIYKEKRKPTITALRKRTIVSAVQQGTMTIQEAQAACRLKRPQSIREWLRAAEQENIELSSRQKGDMNKKSSNDKPAADERIKVLEHALQEAQLKIAALNTLIDVAEEQLKINIRKKPGAKQSPK